MKVAIQGIPGCFHQIAAINYFGKDVDVLPCLTFDELVNQVNNEATCDYGIMAIENSIAGSLLQNYKLLQKNKLKIIGETYLRIEQNLILPKGIELSEIKEIHSHPMAIYQCDSFLKTLPDVKLIEMEDTALAVKNLMTKSAVAKAAIGSLLAAELYNANVIENSIETNKNNYTRFLVISKKDTDSLKETNKSSVYLVLDHHKGSLAKVLDVIAKNSINLSKIQSFPIENSNWQYYFHLDVEYDAYRDFENMVLQLKHHTQDIKVLGNYKNGKPAQEA